VCKKASAVGSGRVVMVKVDEPNRSWTPERRQAWPRGSIRRKCWHWKRWRATATWWKRWWRRRCDWLH